MPANKDPIWSSAPDVQITGAVSMVNVTANTATDGSGTNYIQLFQADSTNGGWLQKIRLKPIGSPVATVLRLYICTATGAFTSGTTNTTTNMALFDEVTLQAVTVSNTAAGPLVEVPFNYALPAGYKVIASYGTNPGATAGWAAVAVAGKY